MSASDPDSTFRVLIVEDHPLMAAATGDLLRSQFPGMSLGGGGSGPTRHEQAGKDDWLRIFVDLCVPGACGLSLLRAFKKLGVVRRCCVVTASRDDRFVAEARRIGVLGYIPKSSTVAEFSRSVRDIMRGVPVFPASFADPEPRVPQLTSRQLAVLQLLHKGLSSKQIAHELEIAEGTAKNHTFALLRALSATNRAHAVARGLELGLVETVAACE
jgi:DNA-binding NarL/FixJ family response regulator